MAVGVLRARGSWLIGSGTARAGGTSPTTSNTTFEIGSLTKLFSAALFAGMVEEGLVALEDPVQRYLPPAVELPVRGRPITLADLATRIGRPDPTLEAGLLPGPASAA